MYKLEGGVQYHARAMLGRMMRVAEQQGWHVCLSADVSSKTELRPRPGRQDIHISDIDNNNRQAVDAHSIYFIKM